MHSLNFAKFVLIKSFNNYLLNTYYVSGSLLGAQDTAVSKLHYGPATWRFHSNSALQSGPQGHTDPTRLTVPLQICWSLLLGSAQSSGAPVSIAPSSLLFRLKESWYLPSILSSPVF